MSNIEIYSKRCAMSEKSYCNEGVREGNVDGARINQTVRAE